MRAAKKHLIQDIASNENVTQAEAERMINAVIEAIAFNLRVGNSVCISNIGTLSPVSKAERLARNPQTGEAVYVPAKLTVRWTASPTLRDVLNGTANRESLATKAPKTVKN